MAGDATTFLDVPLPLPTHLGDCVVVCVIGRRLTMPLFFSEFITAAPWCTGVAEGFCR